MTTIRSVITTLALAAACLPAVAVADIVGEDVSYRSGDTRFEGYYARNTALPGPQPVVLIIHDWDGLDDYERTRARMLARAGYAAFAADLYGAGVRPQTVEDARARSGELYGDRALMRTRVNAAVNALRGLEGVDPERAVAIGYCFGGSAVLELARSGADMQGFVTFHGGLGTPEGQDYADVRAPVLILHGSADRASPMSDVAALAGALDAAGVLHRMEIYGGAPHAFTVWSGERYRPEADMASWDALQGFLAERLGRP
ncbi:dienelactone hydrolase family protein [Arhodomonas aquaeolei]|uniref:dienelactone hydrolase family protein n=1 Tax=Arhodomonas aquaeolei TaxID=2369 RepID=UPI0021678256|nr:dienelactone hydrolase family protein [Arhodomonas aquaeolei]MCS4504508.1 dienelactone hydrolase family protein [Arhodomonas aquaeolei]